MVTMYTQQKFSFRGIFFSFFFSTCVSIGLLGIVSHGEAVSLPTVEVLKEHQDTIFSGGSDQCAALKNANFSQGKKKPALSKLMKKRGVTVPNPTEAPKPKMIKLQKPEKKGDFVFEQSFYSEESHSVFCSRAP